MTDTPETECRERILTAWTTAPDFTLRVTADQSLRLGELRGAPVVLAFYPADWSPVCGDELSVINAALPMLHERRAQVVAVSVDNVWSHEAFSSAHGLHFPLLSDFEPKGAVSRLYGAYDDSTGESRRALFVIDAAGVIAWSYLSPVALNPGVDGVLDALDALTPDERRG
ncbi:redoxin domain-containing protein [Microbacterium sp. NPDC087868]|uniref:redoxin domain-containing protein n=1 Tax=Microbacterium sp. NPDC087868 TaxID=3364195 RepID=UPI00384EF013